MDEAPRGWAQELSQDDGEPVHLPTKKGVLVWVETCRKLMGEGPRNNAFPMVPGSPALGLELGREQPPQGAVNEEDDNGDPRLRLGLRGDWRRGRT